MKKYILFFDEITIGDIPLVGGKNASLGEMIQHLVPRGIRIPNGFATTSAAYWDFLEENKIKTKLSIILDSLDRQNYTNLSTVGQKARELISGATLPGKLESAIVSAYNTLIQKQGSDISLAVRSSATAEDLPEASFAGQQESYLNVRDLSHLLSSCIKCYASLFTDRAIKYREDNGFDHMKVAVSIGIQPMVRSDEACSGVVFTLDPDSGFRNVIHVAGSWGLGENVVKGNVNPDEFYVFKPSLKKNKKAIVSRKCGDKALTMIYSENGPGVTNTDTPADKKARFVLTDDEVYQLARWALVIEDHYGKPMDIEWAKDGINGNLYIVQARPETVFSRKTGFQFKEYTLKKKGRELCKGMGLGNRITTGRARILHSPLEIGKLQEGEILVAEKTDPDWDPIFRKAAAVITNQGGRTSHAAIVARELGVAAVVGTGNATQVIHDGDLLTVSCAEGATGYVYEGKLAWTETEINTEKITMPATEPMLIVADPARAFQYSFLPSKGVGLMRMEFIITDTIQVHPMALRHFDSLKDEKAKQAIEELTKGYSNKADYFIQRLAESTAQIAAGFYPRPVIVRMSDFKSNEYANLLGGKQFEPAEENPMIGFRGASRYYHPLYQDAFEMECRAMQQVRAEMGLENVKIMIPFCRTLTEAEKVIKIMADNGLIRGDNGLELYMMVEIPSNVILAEEFAAYFDGFSIGSNDLTQLTLGADRDSELLSDIFDPFDPAVKRMIEMVLSKANSTHTHIGLCGQAPSDYPAFAKFLVENNINSISFNPDALVKGIQNMVEAEAVMVPAIVPHEQY